MSRDRRVRPVFNGKVTLAAGDVRTEGPGVLNRRTMFPAGIETRVRRIVLPPRAATFEPDVVPAERLQRLTRDSLITFHADGSYESQPLADGAPAERAPARRRAVLPRRRRRRRLARARHRQRQGARVLAGAHRHRRRPALRRRSARTGGERLSRTRRRANRRDRRAGGDGPGRSRGARLDLRAQPLSHPRLSIAAQRHVAASTAASPPARSARRSRGSRRGSSSTIA